MVLLVSGKISCKWEFLLSKKMRIMRLTSVIILATSLHVSAGSYSQKVSLHEKNMPLEHIFHKIIKQTNYSFLWDEGLLKDAPNVSIAGKNMPLEMALSKCLSGSPLTYSISQADRLVYIQAIPKLTVKEHENIEFITITGKVTDEKGNPLNGATIRIEGTKKGTTTNENGRFSIAVNPGDKIQVSFVGYEEQIIIVVEGKTDYTISLNPLTTSLQNLDVNIGYGYAKKNDVTGSIAKAPMRDLTKAPVSNFADALGGRMAGVVVSSPDGKPGSLPNIVIRGNNSVSQANSPLWVIDGFPIEDASLGAINQNDIESIEVLKDASAAAIYGARGANGVIIVTTKKGKSGPPVLDFNVSTGVQNILKKLDLLDPYDYVMYQRERDFLSQNFYVNPNTSVRGPGTVTDSTYFRYASPDDYKKVQGHDFQSQMFRPASFHNYDLSLSGGNYQTKYFISGNIIDMDGIMVNSGFKRYQGRFALDQTISKKMKVGVNANYGNLINWGGSPNSSNVTSGFSGFASLYGIWASRPVSPIDGSGAQNINIANSVFDPALTANGSSPIMMNPVINQKHMLRKGYSNVLSANGYLEYKILSSLTLRITGGITTNVVRNVQFNDTLTNLGSPQTGAGQANGVSGSVIYNHSNSWVNENMLTYSKIFNSEHTITVNGIVSEQGGNTSSNGASANQIPNQSLGISGLDEGTPVAVTATSSNWTLASFTSRLNYDYKKRYFFTATYRADGSSRFSEKNKWAYFPSGALKWNFVNENFMKGQKILSDGSLRLSYGQTGNNRISDFAYLSPISLNLNGAVFNNVIQTAAYPGYAANPDLKWETTSQINLGTDLSVFNSRLNITVDVYRKITKNLLLNANIPPSLGYGSVYKNIGSIQNQGLELNLNGTLCKNKFFTWTSSFNIAWNQNKILSLAQNQDALLSATYFDLAYASSPSYIAKVGQPLGQMYGLVFDGLYQVGDFNITTAINPSAYYPGLGSHYILKDNLPTNGAARTAIQPGDIKYKDLNGDGVINASDMTVIGRGLPIHTGGFTNNFSYKNIDLNIFFQWSYGNNIQNANRILFEGTPTYNGINRFAIEKNRWTPSNTNTLIPRIGGDNGIKGSYTSRTIEDGSYLRLKTVQIGYSFRTKFLKKVGLKSFRLYASGQNLITWTNYSGMDPEISTFNSVLTPNFDYSGYPRARTFTVGANITL